METNQLANGIISYHNQTFKSHYNMTLMDRVYIGVTAVNKGWVDNSVEWMEYALSNIKSEDSKEDIKAAKEFFKTTKDLHDQWLDKKGPVSKTHRTFAIPLDPKLKKKKKYKKIKQRRVPKTKSLIPLFEVPETIRTKTLHRNFMSICEGRQPWRNASYDKNYICRHQHYSNPYMKLGPFKIEELNDEPFVVVFHEFLDKKEATKVNEIALPHLQISKTGAPGIPSQTNLVTRLSKQAWIFDQDFIEEDVENNDGKRVYHLMDGSKVFNNISQDFLLARISQRIELATLTNLFGPYASEAYQIANYGIGGQYR